MTVTEFPVSAEELESHHLREVERLGSSNSNSNKEEKGDLNDIELDDSPPLREHWQAMDFQDAAECMAFFHPALNSLQILMHKWQVKLLKDISTTSASAKHPYKHSICAPNGSGKDSIIIAGCAIFFLLSKIRSRLVCTTASGTQLTAQTETYIKALAQDVNRFYKEAYGTDILKINQRYIKSLLSGSEIILFATDEAGRAEGYHPLDPNSEFIIIVNEAKTVSRDIFSALKRCTGFTRWINISTPGRPAGDFFNSFHRWKHSTHITYKDCPHLSDEELQEDIDEMGEDHPFVKSKWFALFSSVEEDVVINDLELLHCMQADVKLIDLGEAVGLDLAAGGDENVLTYRKGNKVDALVTSRFRDTTETATWADKQLNKWGISLKTPVFADDGGVGHAIIDSLVKLGWTNIIRINNQSPARNKKRYGNKGAELWFNFGLLVKNKLVIFSNTKDEKLRSQLSMRRYRQQEGLGKIYLESKKEAKKHGRPSPDRGDSVVLAFVGVTKSRLLEVNSTTDKVETKRLSFNLENISYSDYQIQERSHGRAFGSLAVILKSQNHHAN